MNLQEQNIIGDPDNISISYHNLTSKGITKKHSLKLEDKP